MQSTTVVGRESKFDKALLLLLRQNQLAFYWRLTCDQAASPVWIATISSILQLGKIRELGAYCSDLYHHLGARNLSLSVCKKDISRLPACCLSCNAVQMVCMPFSRQHNWDLGSNTERERDRPTVRPKGQFLFSLSTRSVCLPGGCFETNNAFRRSCRH